MPARRRHYPRRGPDTGMSGTRAAYDQCAAPGCGHARVRHLAGPPAGCTDISYDGSAGTSERSRPARCTCPGFTPAERT